MVVQAANKEPAEQKNTTRKSTQQLPQSEQNRQKLNQQKLLKEFPHLYGYGQHADATPPDSWHLVRGIDDTPDRVQAQFVGVRRVRVGGRAEELKLKSPSFCLRRARRTARQTLLLRRRRTLCRKYFSPRTSSPAPRPTPCWPRPRKYLARANTSDATDSRRSRSTTVAEGRGNGGRPDGQGHRGAGRRTRERRTTRLPHAGGAPISHHETFSTTIQPPYTSTKSLEPSRGGPARVEPL